MCTDIGPGRSSAHGDFVDCRPPDVVSLVAPKCCGDPVRSHVP